MGRRYEIKWLLSNNYKILRTQVISVRLASYNKYFIPVEVAGVWKGWSEESLTFHKNPWKYFKMTSYKGGLSKILEFRII